MTIIQSNIRYNLKFLVRSLKVIAKRSLEILMVHYMVGSFVNQAHKLLLVEGIIGKFGMCSSLLRMLSLQMNEIPFFLAK